MDARQVHRLGPGQRPRRTLGLFGRGWSLKRYSAQIIEPQAIPLIGYPKAYSPSLKSPLTAEVIHVDPKSEADLNEFKGKLKGAIVLQGAVREVQPRFDPLALRNDDPTLLKMANSDISTVGPSGQARATPPPSAAPSLPILPLDVPSPPATAARPIQPPPPPAPPRSRSSRPRKSSPFSPRKARPSSSPPAPRATAAHSLSPTPAFPASSANPFPPPCPRRSVHLVDGAPAVPPQITSPPSTTTASCACSKPARN